MSNLDGPKLSPSSSSRPALTALIRRLWVPLVLTAAFLGSVAVRAPFLNRPLGSHHEWLTSTVVRTLYIWEIEGAWKTYRFLPIMTYPGVANRHIETVAEGGIPDSLGRRYYVSYPPFAYIAPYVVLRTLGVHIDVLPLQVFSIGLHAICTILIYLIVSLVIDQRGSRYGQVGGVIAASLYIFSPATLWYHSNVYMSDMFVQPLFILAVYLYLKIRLSRTVPRGLLVALGAVIFLMIYTEWLGVLFAFALFLHALYCWRDATMRWLTLTVVVAVVLSFILIMVHYGQIDGLPAFLANAKRKFLERSALSDRYTGRLTLRSWNQIVGHYVEGFFPGTLLYIGITALAALVGSLIGAKKPGRSQLIAPALYLTTIPVVLHHLILFNFTYHHAFSVLKSAVFLTILAGFFSAVFLDGLDGLRFKYWRLATVSLVFAAMVVTCWMDSVAFHQINKLGGGPGYRDTGATIQRLARPDEVVFVQVSDPLGPYPQLVWYAKRNLAVWQGESAALVLMGLDNSEQAIVFTLKADMQIDKVERFVRRGERLESVKPD